MAITTYAELKTAVADFLNRSDMTTAQVETMVQLVEGDIRNDVRVREMEKITSFAVSTETFAAPTLMLEARELSVSGYIYSYVPTEVYTATKKAGSVSRVFTSRGSNFIVNATSGDALLTYYEAPAALTTGTATNYILTYAPDVYLYGACAHASQYFQDAANLERFKALYLGAVDRLNKRENKARFSGSRLHIAPTVRE